ncbi:hypothetical protein LCGC14_2749140, partial [marine sediment metagenome]
EELGQLNLLSIVRDAGTGDIIMLMPTIQKLRALFPKLWIDLYIPAAAVPIIKWWADHDDMVRVFRTEKHDGAKYLKTVDVSWFVERQPLERQGEIDRVSLFAGAFGVELTKAEKKWRMEAPMDARTISVPRNKPVLALGLESAAPHRAPSADLAIRIGKAALKRDIHLLLVGCNRPLPQVEAALCRNGNTQIIAHETLTAVAAMLQWDVDCLICGDTGLYHLAGSMGTPFVAIFGAILPVTRLVGYTNYGFITAKDKLDCIPCLERPKHWDCQPNAPCMNLLDEEEIMDRAMLLAVRRWKKRCKRTTT